MGIKKLFDANKANDILVSTNLEEEVVKNAPELESADNVREQIERINRYIPQVDFDDPNNFVVYGSAQSYYEEAISRVYREFPYDGSEEEITKFHNESTYLDLHVFDNKYPRTTGYAIFSADGWGTAEQLLVAGVRQVLMNISALLVAHTQHQVVWQQANCILHSLVQTIMIRISILLTAHYLLNE